MQCPIYVRYISDAYITYMWRSICDNSTKIFTWFVYLSYINIFCHPLYYFRSVLSCDTFYHLQLYLLKIFKSSDKNVCCFFVYYPCHGRNGIYGLHAQFSFPRYFSGVICIRMFHINVLDGWINAGPVPMKRNNDQFNHCFEARTPFGTDSTIDILYSIIASSAIW